MNLADSLYYTVKSIDLANYLDALLLNNGKTIIDEKIIESLE